MPTYDEQMQLQMLQNARGIPSGAGQDPMVKYINDMLDRGMPPEQIAESIVPTQKPVVATRHAMTMGGLGIQHPKYNPLSGRVERVMPQYGESIQKRIEPVTMPEAVKKLASVLGARATQEAEAKKKKEEADLALQERKGKITNMLRGERPMTPKEIADLNLKRDTFKFKQDQEEFDQLMANNQFGLAEDKFDKTKRAGRVREEQGAQRIKQGEQRIEISRTGQELGEKWRAGQAQTAMEEDLKKEAEKTTQRKQKQQQILEAITMEASEMLDSTAANAHIESLWFVNRQKFTDMGFPTPGSLQTEIYQRMSPSKRASFKRADLE